MFFFGFFLIYFFVSKPNYALENRNETTISECKPGQYPSQVCVLYLKNQQLCGGSIIHLKHVLTSSYCFRDSPMRRNLNKFVLAGDVTWGHVITENSQSRQIVQLIKYPGSYRAGFDLDDIAVLKVNQSFYESYYVYPIRLSSQTPTIGMECTLLGWSQVGLKRKAKNLRKGSVYIQRQIKCGGTLIDDVNRIICGANSDVTHAPCIVDIGGPLICNGYLAGVHTRANHDCDNVTYGSYFMNVAFYRAWIFEMIEWDGEGSMPEPRSVDFSADISDSSSRIGGPPFDSVNIYLLIIMLIFKVEMLLYRLRWM